MNILNSLINGGGMRHNRKLGAKDLILAMAGFYLCWVAVGCMGVAKQAESTPNSASVPELKSRIDALNLALASHKEQVQQLKVDNAGLKIKILESESVIQDLQNRTRGQQQRLDTAIVEVVRSKARLRSLESKAEAASTIAEAEITITGLKKQIAAADTDAHQADTDAYQEVAKADQLLMMSAIEFKARNFGGALYLANQAKGQAQAVQLRYNSDKTGAQEDETRFAQPLPLKCLKNSNLRSGPGLNHKIIGTLARGTLVLGHAHNAGWVRVETSDGQAGWLFQTLVSAR